ncbi:MAG: hypothetical protein LBD85_06440 [Oscillospiraceae bacterium]|jgi:hypothetical protein|nr:hypothetical protein [Oscillospiraceae bacterium]
MNSRFRKAISPLIIAIVTLAVVLAGGCERSEPTSGSVAPSFNPTENPEISSDVPAEIIGFMEDYLNARMVSQEKAIEYARFYGEMADFRHDAFLGTSILRSWEMLSGEKINDKLYAFYYFSDDTPQDGIHGWSGFAYNFVCVESSDEMYVIANVKYLPDEFTEGLVREKYEITDDEYDSLVRIEP